MVLWNLFEFDAKYNENVLDALDTPMDYNDKIPIYRKDGWISVFAIVLVL